jgi:hypothetical protein
LDDSKSNIDNIESEIKMYGSCNPKDIFFDSDNPIRELQINIGILLTELKEETIKHYNLSLLLENFDKRIDD